MKIKFNLILFKHANVFITKKILTYNIAKDKKNEFLKTASCKSVGSKEF